MQEEHRGQDAAPKGPGWGARPCWGWGRGEESKAPCKIIAPDRSVSSARLGLNFIMVSVTMATCKNNVSASKANSP